MKRPRFSLRLLLVVITITAVALGVWRLWPTGERITEQQVLAIKLQMTPSDVESIAGTPRSYTISRPTSTFTWTYHVVAPLGLEPDRLIVSFGSDGRVRGIVRDQRGEIALPH